ncbi:arginine/serine-rich coiled-coil protein 2 isoform X2 [Momordica charantia]|uniref:Arginine/serine-rich coiled-coil protein 2 isoform X2 n=1 Tax=Momordica charantia TaxID=3673 RepID=A0A6J1DIU6_MOMCH|nr:arginine/serine-rich coiled-coil protein 2 isoform X2 [Momordica charantia]
MDNAGMKAEFRKPSSETASRKYRRRSSVSGSSSSDESPKRDRSCSPKLMRDDAPKDSERQLRRKDDERDVNKDSSRSHYSRNSDSYRYADRKSSRSSHGYSRHDDYVRHDKYADEERDYERLSSRSGRESKGGAHYGHSRRDSEHSRSRDYYRDGDKSSRDKYDGSGHRSRDGDSLSERHGSGRRHVNSQEMEKHRNIRDRDGRDEKRDHIKHPGDDKNDRLISHDDARGNRNDSLSGRDESRYRTKEVYRSDRKELDGEKFSKEEKKYEARETNWDKGQGKESKENYDGKGVFVHENQGSPAKKPKLLSSGKEVNHEDEENQSSISKQEPDGKMSLGQGQSGDSDFDADFSAAKVAAMKAAELVNKNLVGVGYMTADQKKKLLWGNKKSTAVEESGHQWDTALFTDRERQEKFNKLMGVKGELKTEHRPSNQDGSELLRAEKQKELQLDLEKQYTAGLRRRDGRTVGLGL